MTQGSARAHYERLRADRDRFLQRARKAAAYTLPYVMPPEGKRHGQDLVDPYQSVGARGAINLASKLSMTLFPPSHAWFRLVIDDSAEALLQSDEFEASRKDIEDGLAYTERILHREFETGNYRVPLSEALTHLVVCGNILLYYPTRAESRQSRTYSLDQYVCERDPSGNVLRIVIHEEVDYEAAEERVRQVFSAQHNPEANQGGSQKTIDLYTHIWLDNGTYKVRQEAENLPIPGTDGSYPKERMPYFPVRFYRVSGESYGRGHVEQYMGDLESLEALTEAIVKGSQIAAKCIILARPGLLSLQKLQEAGTGDIIQGSVDDIAFVRSDKQADFGVAQAVAEGIKQRLEFGFLLAQSFQRNAERVTAEEIRIMAQELEDTLGGIYAVLTEELQLPLITYLLQTVEGIPDAAKDPKAVKPAIVTGVDALGRGHEFQALQLAVREITQSLGEMGLAWIKPGAYAEAILNNAGLDAKQFLKTEEEFQAEQEQQQAAQIVQDSAPEVVKQGLSQTP